MDYGGGIPKNHMFFIFVTGFNMFNTLFTCLDFLNRFNMLESVYNLKLYIMNPD